MQLRRPEVSSALAAVLDRATAKDLGERYADGRAAHRRPRGRPGYRDRAHRPGHRRGDHRPAHAPAQRPAPRAAAPPPPGAPAGRRGCSVVGRRAIVAFILLADRAERGTGSRNVKAPRRAARRLAQAGRGQRLRPAGRRHDEHPDQAKAVVDGQPETSWDTEGYRGSALRKDGVGIYVDAAPDVAAPAPSRCSAARRAGAARSTARPTARAPTGAGGLPAAGGHRRRRAPHPRPPRPGPAAAALLPRVDHGAAAGRGARGDLRDPAVPLAKLEAYARSSAWRSIARLTRRSTSCG